eukprot:350044-Chlamydomonas_euryale.AAC.5
MTLQVHRDTTPRHDPPCPTRNNTLPWPPPHDAQALHSVPQQAVPSSTSLKTPSPVARTSSPSPSPFLP